MALTKGTNSYVSVAEADAYFWDRLDAVSWLSNDNIRKGQALVTATSLLDTMNWSGVAVSETQALAFPRMGEYFDPRVGTVVGFGNEVPKRVIDATFELAHHLLNNSGLFDETGSVTNLQVGSIVLEKITTPPKVPGSVLRQIKPMLENGGTNLWWRAN